MGYLPEALLNYLGMMGWTMPNGDEVFTLAAMEAAFDISRVSLGGRYSIQKSSIGLTGNIYESRAAMQTFRRGCWRGLKIQVALSLLYRCCDNELRSSAMLHRL